MVPANFSQNLQSVTMVNRRRDHSAHAARQSGDLVERILVNAPCRSNDGCSALDHRRSQEAAPFENAISLASALLGSEAVRSLAV